MSGAGDSGATQHLRSNSAPQAQVIQEQLSTSAGDSGPQQVIQAQVIQEQLSTSAVLCINISTR